LLLSIECQECQLCKPYTQIGETSNTELDSIIQQIKHIKYKGKFSFVLIAYTVLDSGVIVVYV